MGKSHRLKKQGRVYRQAGSKMKFESIKLGMESKLRAIFIHM